MPGFFLHMLKWACYDFEQEWRARGRGRRPTTDLGQRRPFLFLPSLMLPSFRLARRNLNGRRSLPFTIRFAVMHLFPRGCFSFATHAPHRTATLLGHDETLNLTAENHPTAALNVSLIINTRSQTKQVSPPPCPPPPSLSSARPSASNPSEPVS